MDVARKAGVSRATVSYVLNGVTTEGKVPISEETRLRVLSAIEELAYVPDARARALRMGDTKTIGFMMPDIRNPHFWATAEAVELEARDHGYHLLLSSASLKQEYAKEIFNDLSHRRIDGLIVPGTFRLLAEEDQASFGRFMKRQFPIVEISDFDNEWYGVDQVWSNYASATDEAIAYLLRLNHRRIALLFGVESPVLARDRFEPYREGLLKGGIPVEEELIVRCGPTIEEGYQATLTLLNLPQRPTAIIAINDLLAIGALRAIHDRGLRVPEDISLMGYDDISMAKYLVPRLTTVTKDIDLVGRAAVKLLLERLNHPDAPLRSEFYPAQLIIRESTAPAPN